MARAHVLRSEDDFKAPGEWAPGKGWEVGKKKKCAGARRCGLQAQEMGFFPEDFPVLS